MKADGLDGEVVDVQEEGEAVMCEQGVCVICDGVWCVCVCVCSDRGAEAAGGWPSGGAALHGPERACAASVFG